MDLTLRQKMGIAYVAGICIIGATIAFYAAATATASFGMWVGIAGASVFLGAMSLFLGSWLQYTRRDGPPTREERVSQYQREGALLLVVLLSASSE